MITSNAEQADPIAQPAHQPVSPKQLEANRRNARKSSGPRTPAGRAAASMNALKHGILSKEVLVRGLHIQESSQELSALHERFWTDLKPVGPVEEMLVDQIVTTHWRWRRALKAESGEIALSVDQGQWNRRLKPELLALWWKATLDPIFRMKESAAGLGFLAEKLLEVRAAVEREGQLTSAAIQALAPTLGDSPNEPARGLEALRLKLQENPEGLEAGALRERNKRQALAHLDKELRSLELLKEEREERESHEEQSRQAASVLPAMPVLEKIIRYETKLERQLYRAMTQLERLQRLGQGEAVPPPLTMEVSA
jgi:hypothetical protein